tara:strand:+ start:96 stop:929 length:834 start_codon:yes stop_codon:yes gene_type:complete
MIIWLASYPKSGNTWVRSFLSAYYFTDDGMFNFDLLDNFKQFPSKDFINMKLSDPGEIVNYWHSIQDRLMENKKIKMLKTHNALISFNKTKFTLPKYSLGAVYILRDPRNLITSLKDHTDITYDEALRFMCNEDTILYDTSSGDYDATHFISSWSTHYKSWTSDNNIKTMVIKYEDLETDCNKIFKDLVIFINKLLKNSDVINEEKLYNAIKSTNFKNLRKKEELGEFKESVISLKTNKKVKFFNLGFENKWQKILPDKIKSKVNDKFADDLKYLNY